MQKNSKPIQVGAKFFLPRTENKKKNRIFHKKPNLKSHFPSKLSRGAVLGGHILLGGALNVLRKSKPTPVWADIFSQEPKIKKSNFSKIGPHKTAFFP